MALSFAPRVQGLEDHFMSRSAYILDRVLLGALRRVYGSTGLDGDLEYLRERMRRGLDFYTQPRFLSDPDAFYRPPRACPVPHLRKRARLPDGAVFRTTLESAFEPVNPDVRGEYLEYRENRRIHLYQLLHRDPRPTMVYVHGWLGGNPNLEFRMFPPKAVYDKGFDVTMFTLPFHGARTPRQARFGGQLFPNADLERTNEAFAHAIHDLRVSLEFIRHTGRGPIGLFGVSLGAYIATLLSGLGEDLAFLALMIPLASMADNFWDNGDGTRVKRRAAEIGVTRANYERMNLLHEPLRYAPRLPPERILILAGKGDALCSRPQIEALDAHFVRPRVRWFSGGHLLQFDRARIGKELATFAARSFAHATEAGEATPCQYRSVA